MFCSRKVFRCCTFVSFASEPPSRIVATPPAVE
jgi:hypothetical protein